MAVQLGKRDYSLEVLNCRRGEMVAFRFDEVISRSLRMYGEWAEHELSCLRPYVTEGQTVIDVGAHLGTHTLAFAKWAGTGKVIAIEAQPEVAAALSVNCLLNSKHNIQVINAVCCDRMDADYRMIESETANFGAIGFRPSESRLARFVHKLMSRRSAWKSNIQTVRLAEFCGQSVSLIKIDVETMEVDVLRGGVPLFETCQPIIFLEQNDTRQLASVHNLLVRLGYRLFWLETHPFNRFNFRKVTENIWWRTETGILALPRHLAGPSSACAVRGDEAAVPKRLNVREGAAVEKE